KIADRAVTQAKLGTDVISPGVVWMTAAPNPPDGWLLCDGQAVSRSTYSDLFAVIGTLYGPGDGINTFNLPNYKGRVPVHLDSDQTEFDTLNKRGGQKQVGLTASNLPSHTHPFSATTSNQSANHVHNVTAISMDPEGTQPSQFGLGVLSV